MSASVTEAPTYRLLLPSFATAENVRLWLLAPTEVTQGTCAGLPMVPACGPELPLDVATRTPLSAAKRKAMSSIPMDDVDEPTE